MYKPLVLSLVLLLCADVNCQRRKKQKTDQIDCQAAVIRSDRCWQDLILINATKLPRTEQEVQNGFCADFKDRMSCINSRRSCYKSFSRTLYDSGARATANYFKNYCKSAETRAKLAKEVTIVTIMIDQSYMTSSLRSWNVSTRTKRSRERSRGSATRSLLASSLRHLSHRRR